MTELKNRSIANADAFLFCICGVYSRQLFKADRPIKLFSANLLDLMNTAIHTLLRHNIARLAQRVRTGLNVSLISVSVLAGTAANTSANELLPDISIDTATVSSERLNRVRHYMDQGDYQRAERDLRLMVGYRDTREVVLFGIQAAIRMHDWDLAKQRVNYYDSRYPETPEVDEFKSEIFLADKDLRQSFHHTQRAIRLIEQPSAALYERQALLKVAVLGYPAVKNQLLYTAIAEYGFQESFADLLFEVAIQHNDWNKASEVAERFAKTAPDSLKWKMRQSKAYANTSRTEEAKAICRLANNAIAKRYGFRTAADKAFDQALDCRLGGLG